MSQVLVDVSQQMPLTGQRQETVDTRHNLYMQRLIVWRQIEAALGGDSAVKRFDATSGNRILLPLSDQMPAAKYRQFQDNTSFSGLTGAFVEVLHDALLRTPPRFELLPRFASDQSAFFEQFSKSQTLLEFLSSLTMLHLATSQAIVYVDYDDQAQRPYAELIDPKTITNWKTNQDGELIQLFVRRQRVANNLSTFEEVRRDEIIVHELIQGFYQVRQFVNQGNQFELVSTIQPTRRNERLTRIPLFFVSGQIEPPAIAIERYFSLEKAIYNATARRDHVLRLASFVTPIVAGENLADDEDRQQAVIDAGFGNYVFLNQDDTLTFATVPTENLEALERSINDRKMELARLGIRLLTPEQNQPESGVALSIRNNLQSIRLSSFSTQITSTIREVIQEMLLWFTPVTDIDDIDFELQHSIDDSVILMYLSELQTLQQNDTITREELRSKLEQTQILSTTNE